MADDEEHGRNHTLANIARKHFCLELTKGLSTPTGPELPRQQMRKCDILAIVEIAKPLGVPLCFLQDIRMGNSVLFYSFLSFFSFFKSTVKLTQWKVLRL